MHPPYWNDFLKHFEQEQQHRFIVSLLKQTTPHESAGILTLECVNQGAKIAIDKRRLAIEELIASFTNSKHTIITTLKAKTKKDEAPPLLTYRPSQDDIFKRAGLNPKFKFDNFAVFSSNQVAYAAAQAIAKTPGTAYNPLFLWGGVGVGKTHLAQAIAHSILDSNPEYRVFFCPGDLFTNELVEAIRDKSTPKFRRKYRNLDFLIIDDVQFIAGKQSVQEEIFHTFNTIVSASGQIILTSDKPPSEIKSIEDRLRSRFSGGLIVDVQPPDFELRTAILIIKAREKNIEIDIEAAKIIAENIADTRALEGALLSIGAKIWGIKDIIDLDAVEMYFNEQKATPSVKKISAQDVIKAVCTYYNVKPLHIKSPTRVENIAFARQVIMYLLREQFGMKLEEVAFTLKRKDHTTVMHGVDKIKSALMKNTELKQQIDTIAQTIRSST